MLTDRPSELPCSFCPKLSLGVANTSEVCFLGTQAVVLLCFERTDLVEQMNQSMWRSWKPEKVRNREEKLHKLVRRCFFFFSPRACCSNSTVVNGKKETQIEIKFTYCFSVCCRLEGKRVHRERKDGQMFPIWFWKLHWIILIRSSVVWNSSC